MTFSRSLNISVIVLCVLLLLDTTSDEEPLLRSVLIGIVAGATFGALYTWR